MGFLSAARRVSSNAFNTVTEIVDNFRINKSGINSLDNALGNANYVIDGGVIKVGGKEFSSVAPNLRLGNIRKVLNDLGIANNVSKLDEVNFKSIYSKNLPDVPIDIMNNKIQTAKLVQPDLDLKATSGADLQTKLTPQAKSKLEVTLGKITKIGAATGIVAGIIAAIIIGTDMYDELVKATESRNGVYIVKTVGTKTERCKISANTCTNINNANVPSCAAEDVALIPPNVLMALMDAKATSSVKTTIENATSLTLPSDNFNSWLGIGDNYTTLKTFVEDPANRNLFSYDCSKYGSPEKCINWDGSATAYSIEFANLSDLPDNMTVVCVEDSTILDTLVDVGVGIGEDIVSGLGNSISNLWQQLGNWPLIIGAVMAVLIVLTIIVSMIRKR